ncbi:class I SAM-dependent methyltransferase [Arenibaculum pallidiluteum]|uniref:class I SAM-dependent methyltransferase n=1 Tax=Arenibaculum pallidiluteum TaxID=2812559 RepID=UPI001A9703DA|nr:methyltransferase domain-containing protein [Arenibaculum pallidiluteum]
MTDDFARIYERTGNRITAPIAMEGFRRVGSIGEGTRVLDIAAGAGALSVPAAYSGASVLAVDIAPGMVNLLSERLAPFPKAEARVMDGQDLQIADDSFDAAFSIFGVSLFADWRRGLREQARVVRPGGMACVATWQRPPGGGPFMIMAQALRSVFPDRAPPAPAEGFVALSDPSRLAAEMRSAGFADVEVEEIQAVWHGPAGPAYLEEVRALNRYMAPYVALSDDERKKVEDAILRVVGDLAVGDRLRIVAPVLLAVAGRSS